ncbi:MAG: hypothetical protein EBZ98_06030, partial [Actinobacteria bacterium]|nr:hypothetical protein [Actinomycetota bacterium]
MDDEEINMTNDETATLAPNTAANDGENGLWERAAAVLRQQVSEAVWFSTFSDIIVERDGNGKVGGTMSLTLRVPNTFVRDRVLTRYMSLVRDALNEAGGSAHELHVDVRPVPASPTNTLPTEAQASAVPFVAPNTTVPAVVSKTGRGAAVGLNPRYTFDTFVK